jgi:hypothetical protein
MSMMQDSQPGTSLILPLLIKLKESGIRIQLQDGQLKVNAPKGKLNPALIDELKKRKEEIIVFLQRSGEKHVKHSAIETTEEKDYYPLSSAQKRLYILQQMTPDTTVYNIPQFLELAGKQEAGKLADTFKKLIDRHESLRTFFHMIDGEPVQRIHTPGRLEFQLENHNPGAANPGEIIKDFIHPFDLAKPPLVRAGLIKIEPLKHILMVDMHHIISDGISQGILIGDFAALANGKQLPPLKLQYKDYAGWQQSQEIQQTFKQQEEYWLGEFQGEIPVLNLPTDNPRPTFQSFAGDMIEFQLSPEQSGALYEISQARGVTLFMLLLTVFNILLSKLSGQEEIVMGTPIAGRGHADLEPIIGMFVNTLALRNYPRTQKNLYGTSCPGKRKNHKSL